MYAEGVGFLFGINFYSSLCVYLSRFVFERLFVGLKKVAGAVREAWSWE